MNHTDTALKTSGVVLEKSGITDDRRVDCIVFVCAGVVSGGVFGGYGEAKTRGQKSDI